MKSFVVLFFNLVTTLGGTVVLGLVWCLCAFHLWTDGVLDFSKTFLLCMSDLLKSWPCVVLVVAVVFKPALNSVLQRLSQLESLQIEYDKRAFKMNAEIESHKGMKDYENK